MQPGRGLPCSTGRAAATWQQQQQHPRQQLWPGVPRGHCKQHWVVTAAAAGTSNSKQQAPSKQQQPASSRGRNARLYELFDDDGWGVEAVVPAAQQPAASPAAAPAQPKRAQNPQQQTSEQGKRRKAGTRFADMRSQEGKLGLTLLQKVLLNEEEQQQQQQQQQGSSAAGEADSSSSRDQPSIADVRAKLAAAADSSKRLKPKLPGFPKSSAAGGAAAAAAGSGAGGQLFGQASSGSELMYGDEEEDDDEDEATPAFQITFDEQGRAAMESFTSEEGTAAAGDGEDADSDVDLDDFGMSGWGQFAPDEPVQQAQPPTQARGRKAASTAKDDDDDEAEMALLRDLSNEDDWGLEALTTPARSTFDRQQRIGRRSLVDELTAAEEEELEGSGNAFNGSVRWGGTAGTTGIDMEEQEAVLTRYFRPDQVKKLMKEQQEVDESYSVLRRRAVGLGVSDHKLQEKLRIVSGSAAGRKLVSFRSPQTRPMMEKVRQAIFNMLQSRAGTLNSLPRTARWLDLFAGTGSVGLEALSRGVREAHFVEMDPVVVSKILDRNIKSCGFKGKAWTHTSKAEDFLRRSAATPRFAGGAFDFISVCPPYLLVSYPELFELLDASPLVHPGTILFVEYPKQLSHQIVDSIGPLQRVRDRRYGRTWVALYAAGAADDDGDADELADPEDPFLAMQ